MQVDIDNFVEQLPQVLAAIEQADFVSIDTELSGLHSSHHQESEFYDTLEERYTKTRDSAQSFTITQFGVCAFIWDGDAQLYRPQPFNFYLYPLAQRRTNMPLELRGMRSFVERDNVFLCQPSSLHFLAEQDFDFNRWIKKGVPFLSVDKEDRLRQFMKQYKTSDIALIEEKDIEFVNTSMAFIQSWLQHSILTTLEIPAKNSYERRLIHQETKKRFNGALHTEGVENIMRIKKLTNEERRLNDVSLQFETAMKELVGFRKVVDAIINSEKIVVGHNMFLDLCHTIEKFNRPLPERYEDFKILVNSLFPKIYDTKFLAVTDPELAQLFGNTSLSELMNRVQSTPFIQPRLESSPYSGAVYHEAGYDAYATGCVFLRMVAKIMKRGIENTSRLDLLADELHPFASRIKLMRSDIPCMRLDDVDETADRSKVFHIYGFPSSTKQVDIVSAFKQYGQVYIRWKDDTSCFLGIKSKIMAEVVKKDFKLVVTTSDDDDEEDGKDAEEENENEKPGKQQQQHQEGEEEVGGARTWRGSFGTFKIETFDQYQGGNDDEESEQEETVTIMEEGEIPKGTKRKLESTGDDPNGTEKKRKNKGCDVQ